MSEAKQRFSLKLTTAEDIQKLRTYGLLKLVEDSRYIQLGLTAEKVLKEAGFDLTLDTYMVQLSRMLVTLMKRDEEIRKKLSSLNADEIEKVTMILSLVIIERLLNERIVAIGIPKVERGEIPKYKLIKKKAFVAMPLSPSFDNVWRDGIAPACESEGISCMRADATYLPTARIEYAIERQIESSDFVIADITGNNPNVMLELGLAIGSGKKIIAIRRRDDPHEIPFDITAIPYISYDNAQELKETLSKQIRKLLRLTSKTSQEQTTR